MPSFGCSSFHYRFRNPNIHLPSPTAHPPRTIHHDPSKTTLSKGTPNRLRTAVVTTSSDSTSTKSKGALLISAAHLNCASLFRPKARLLIPGTRNAFNHHRTRGRDSDGRIAERVGDILVIPAHEFRSLFHQHHRSRFQFHPLTMSSGSKKRKISEVAATKYYAVRAGHTPGVYTVWADCQQNITGFKGAQCTFLP